MYNYMHFLFFACSLVCVFILLIYSNTELVSAVISSALGCGDIDCPPLVNSTHPIKITLNHRDIEVSIL